MFAIPSRKGPTCSPDVYRLVPVAQCLCQCCDRPWADLHNRRQLHGLFHPLFQSSDPENAGSPSPRWSDREFQPLLCSCVAFLSAAVFRRWQPLKHRPGAGIFFRGLQQALAPMPIGEIFWKATDSLGGRAKERQCWLRGFPDVQGFGEMMPWVPRTRQG